MSATACAAALHTLPACSTLEYRVDVRNDARRSVQATLQMEQLANPLVLASATVGPGETATLGPVKTAPFDSVELRVSSGELGGVDARTRLLRGHSTAVVETDSWGSVGVRIEE